MDNTGNNTIFASLLLVICTTMGFADPTHEKASPQDIQLSRVSIGLGAVESISLPLDWKLDRVPNSTSTDQYFHEVKTGAFKDCNAALGVYTPHKCNPETIRHLELGN